MGRVNRHRVRELLVMRQDDAAVVYLREVGLTKIESIELLKACGLGSREAESVVHDSHAWADVGQSDREVHQGLASRYADQPGVSIDEQNVPKQLRALLPLARIWAIGDDVERSDFMEQASFEEKKDLVDMVVHTSRH